VKDSLRNPGQPDHVPGNHSGLRVELTHRPSASKHLLFTIDIGLERSNAIQVQGHRLAEHGLVAAANPIFRKSRLGRERMEVITLDVAPDVMGRDGNEALHAAHICFELGQLPPIGPAHAMRK
jgi:hypothetical protein